MDPDKNSNVNNHNHSNYVHIIQSSLPSRKLKQLALHTVLTSKNILHPDTAATGHFITIDHPGELIEHQPLEVKCANNSIMRSIATKLLYLPHLPTKARIAHVFAEMERSLLSISILCDAGCKCIFEEEKVTIMKNNNTIIQGKRDDDSTLWCIPTTVQLAPPPGISSNNNNNKNNNNKFNDNNNNDNNVKPTLEEIAGRTPRQVVVALPTALSARATRKHNPEGNLDCVTSQSTNQASQPPSEDSSAHRTKRDIRTNFVLHQSDIDNSFVNTYIPKGCIKSNHHAFGVYQSRTAAEMTAFQHATLCAPTVKTLINAINNKWLTTFPCLTAQNVRRHLPKSIQTTMGHLHRMRQGTRSTKPPGEKYSIEELMNEDEDDEHDIIPEPHKHNHILI